MRVALRTIPCPLYLDNNNVIDYDFLFKFIIIYSVHILLEHHILIVLDTIHFRVFFYYFICWFSLLCVYTLWASSGSTLSHLSVVHSNCLYWYRTNIASSKSWSHVIYKAGTFLLFSCFTFIVSSFPVNVQGQSSLLLWCKCIFLRRGTGFKWEINFFSFLIAFA